jgi:hypothetical protein
MNIGSVGLPFDGLAKASYGILEIIEGNISTTIQRVSVDIEKAAGLYHEVGYPNAEMMGNIIRNGHL